MRGMKFDLQDLDLDEGGIHTELVITHHDGSASFILSDDELKDLHAAVLTRFWQRFPPHHLAPKPLEREIRYEAGEQPPWASYRNGKLIGRYHSEQAAMLRQDLQGQP